MHKLQFKVHPAANAFPMMDRQQFASLKQDIEKKGQQDYITFWREQLIDGRNRLRACEELGIEPLTCELDDDADPLAFIISANLHRRHLTTAQRSMVAAELATLEKGGDRKSEDFKGQNCPLIDDAASLLSVSPRTVRTAKQVKEKGSLELVDAVKSGDVTVSQAANLCKAVPDKKKQTKLVKEGKQAIKAAIKPQPKQSNPKTAKADAKAEKVDATAVDDPAPLLTEESEEYDLAVLRAFEHCDYRLNTLMLVIDSLQKHEIEVLKNRLLSRHS